MNPRYLRALQTGGMAMRIGRDGWGVWRARDKRRRSIGAVSGAEIELFRMRGSLVSLGSDPDILIWSGPIEDVIPSRAGPDLLRDITAQLDGPFVEYVVSRCKSVALREQLRKTVQAYRWDHVCAEQRSGPQGMNWRGLALGGRIQGGPMRTPDTVSFEAARAAARLRQLRAQLRSEQVEFLDQLILSGANRDHLMKHYQLRASLLEARAVALLRLVSDLYAAMRID